MLRKYITIVRNKGNNLKNENNLSQHSAEFVGVLKINYYPVSFSESSPKMINS